MAQPLYASARQLVATVAAELPFGVTTLSDMFGLATFAPGSQPAGVLHGEYENEKRDLDFKSSLFNGHNDFLRCKQSPTTCCFFAV
jgi:hypothetical protein